MRPVVSALKRNYRDDVEFIIVDVRTDDGRTLAGQYRVTATPTYLFITSDGFTMGTLRGRQDLEDMEAALDQLLETSARPTDPKEQLAEAIERNEKVMLSFILPG